MIKTYYNIIRMSPAFDEMVHYARMVLLFSMFLQLWVWMVHRN